MPLLGLAVANRRCSSRRRRRRAGARRRRAAAAAAADDQPADLPEGHAAPAGDRDDAGVHAVARRRSATTATCRKGAAAATTSRRTRSRPKKAARGMMLLAREINTKLPEAVGKAADATTRVGCATCHRGVPIPKQIADIVTDASATRRLGRGPRQVQGAAREVLRRPELRLQRGRPDRGRAARQQREQDRRRARLPASEPGVLPEVGAHLCDDGAVEERQRRQGRRDRRAREGGRARSEQRAGEGAAREL